MWLSGSEHTVRVWHHQASRWEFEWCFHTYAHPWALTAMYLWLTVLAFSHVTLKTASIYVGETDLVITTTASSCTQRWFHWNKCLCLGTYWLKYTRHKQSRAQWAPRLMFSSLITEFFPLSKFSEVILSPSEAPGSLISVAVVRILP